jgi:hypothetical protein
LNIGLKEINGCDYWLDLLFVTDYINKRMHDSMKKDSVELLKILIANIKTTKAKGKISK